MVHYQPNSFSFKVNLRPLNPLINPNPPEFTSLLRGLFFGEDHPVHIALLFLVSTVVPGCWIPLPEETAIVVSLLDAQGDPVDGVELLLDSSDTVVTGAQLNAGQVFVSLNTEGDHTLQLDTSTLLDPQGGVGWVPLASHISGELAPLSFANRPFVDGAANSIPGVGSTRVNRYSSTSSSNVAQRT